MPLYGGSAIDVTADNPCCPDAETLRRFLWAQVSGAQADALEEHVLHCLSCCRAARTLRVDDSLVAAMHGAAPSDGEDSERSVVAALIGKLRPLRRLVASSAAGTMTGGDSGVPAVRAVCDALAPPQEADEVGRVGPYGILRVLGSGGMGVVFAARQASPRRLVALKMLLTDRNGGRLARFRSETEIVAGLRHPNIVQVHEANSQDGRPYFTMEYVDGGSLAQKLAAAPLTAPAAANLVAALARAIHFAHERGVIHRDLKPANVLLTEDGTPKIGDFGLAKHFGDAAGFAVAGCTESGALLGTPNYMAPEQATGRNQDVGRSADVYALGAILYECLTGRPPFKAATVLETLEQVRTQEPVPPGRLQPRLPRDLQTICLKCLDKEPRRRYASARALADDLERFLAGKPIVARPVRAWERAWKWARRKPAVAALVAVSVLSALALAASVLIYNNQLHQALDRAETNETKALKQQELADARYRSARDSLRKMLNRLDAERLADTPRLLELRLALLEDSQAFYQTVLEQTDNPDPAIRIDVAFIVASTGSVQFMLGKQGPARTSLERAVKLLEELHKELPADHAHHADCVAQLAGCHSYLAGLDRGAGRWDDAERHFGAALALYERMAGEHPDDRKWLIAQGDTEHLIGAYHQLRDQRPEAMAHYQKSVALRNQLVAAYPKDDDYRVQLAGTEQNLGLIYAQLGRTGDAQTAYEKTIQLLQPLSLRHPENTTYRLTLAAACVNQGGLLMGLGKLDDAAKVLDLGIEAVETVLQREPRHVFARARGLQAHGARAQLHDGLEQWADAVKHWDRVVELNDAPSTWLYRLYRAVALSRAGDHTRAAAEAQALEQDPEISADALSNLAGVYVRSIEPARKDATMLQAKREALAEGYAVRAVAQYQKLLDRDYFANPHIAKAFANDKDLRILYDRGDFQKVMERVKSAKKKTSH